MSKVEEATGKKGKQAGEKLIEEEKSERGGVGAGQGVTVLVSLLWVARLQPVITALSSTVCWQVKMAVFVAYCKALGLCNAFMVLFFFLIYQVASVYSNIWLSSWTEDNLLKNDSLYNTSKYTDRRDLYLGIYGGLGLLQGGNWLVHGKCRMVVVDVRIFCYRSVESFRKDYHINA